MLQELDHSDRPVEDEYVTVHVAFELSRAKWRVGVMLPGSSKLSSYVIDGGDVTELSRRLWEWRARAGSCGQRVRVLSCYEAGRDGHWLHRWLEQQGVVNHEIDPSSIEVSRRARRAKTDRIDLAKLMRSFLAHLRGEPRVCSVVHVPTAAEEDRKRRPRERLRLGQERSAHSNRIQGLLFGQGIRDERPRSPGFLARLERLRTGDGRELPAWLKEEIRREHERLCLVGQQLRALDAESAATLRASAAGGEAADEQIRRLVALRGIGLTSAQALVGEVFYRSFANRRQVGGYLGLTGTPYDSGESRCEQGISKAGNPRARRLAVELGWLWLRHQPDSALSRWFWQRVGEAKGRVRRIALVALARRLMVALWRYLTTGLVPEGAVLRPGV
jgi:transposase